MGPEFKTGNVYYRSGVWGKWDSGVFGNFTALRSSCHCAPRYDKLFYVIASVAKQSQGDRTLLQIQTSPHLSCEILDRKRLRNKPEPTVIENALCTAVS